MQVHISGSFARRVAGIVAIAAVISVGCERQTATSAGESAPVTVDVATAAEKMAPNFVTVTGVVEPIVRVSPASKIMGRVDKTLVNEGDHVRTGQKLAVLDSRDLDAARGQADAAVRMAEANLQNAEAMHRRMVVLHERGSATDKNLEDATTGLSLGEAGVDQAKANLTAAKVMLSYAEIKSPVAGFVTAKRVVAGDMAAPGAPLFTIEDISRVKISVQVPESDFVGLEKGQAASAHIDVLGQDFSAKVDRIVPTGDSMSRTFEIQLLLDNPDGRIKPGMFARARFARGTRPGLTVPLAAVVSRGELRGLFVVEADNRARLRWVRLGREQDGQVDVISGLAPGERFIPAPPPGLMDGAAVAAR
jgi:RND family efflux transporter MFP subunit